MEQEELNKLELESEQDYKRGVSLEEVGEFAEALKNYTSSLQKAQILTEEYKNSHDYHLFVHAQALCKIHISTCLVKLEEYDEALKTGSESLDLLQKTVELNEDYELGFQDLCNVSFRVALLFKCSYRLEDVDRICAHFFDFVSGKRLRTSESEVVRFFMGKMYSYHGACLKELGRDEEAMIQYRTGIEILSLLTKDYPEKKLYEKELNTAREESGL